ncbi:122_t:CDS:1, partial [Cetraspora pellucida]
AIFERWVKSLNTSCRLKKKKILLLIDGASSHSNNEYTHIKLHILPPHTTSYSQLCDAEIINLFKSYYRKLYLQNIVDAINAKEEIPRLNILEAIR